MLSPSGDEAIVRMLEPIRVAHHLPALGGAIVASHGLVSSGVTGVRKLGAAPEATVDDLWHLGSDTKAMTATMIAILVERGQLSWDRTLGEAFGDAAREWPAAFRGITLTQLLSHRAGLTANLSWGQIARSSDDIRQQRFNAVAAAATVAPVSAPGTAFLYSNLGFTIAAAMAERAANKSWEDLISSLVFTPLGMSSCGFGGTGTIGRIDQPWPHMASGQPAPSNGPDMDNKEVMGPAGMVHCSIADWSRFLADQLSGARGAGQLLKPDGYRMIQAPKGPAGTAMGGADYAFGWGVVSRPWAQGVALTHAGSNTMNYCDVWIAPAIDLAVLAVTNSGVADAGAAADEAVSALIVSRVKK